VGSGHALLLTIRPAGAGKAGKTNRENRTTPVPIYRENQEPGTKNSLLSSQQSAFSSQ